MLRRAARRWVKCGSDPFGLPYLDISPQAVETQTGKLSVGVGVNSDAGLVGSIVIDEQNIDPLRWPSSSEDVRNATAFRGGGDQLRIELRRARKCRIT